MKSTARLAAIITATSLSLLMPESLLGQPKDANYDEAKVPKYTLPDPLLSSEGTRITTSHEWQQKRRPEILRLFDELNLQGKTLILVTHDNNVAEHAHRAIRLCDGLIESDVRR